MQRVLCALVPCREHIIFIRQFPGIGLQRVDPAASIARIHPLLNVRFGSLADKPARDKIAPLFAVSPIADKLLRCRDCPLSAESSHADGTPPAICVSNIDQQKTPEHCPGLFASADSIDPNPHHRQVIHPLIRALQNARAGYQLAVPRMCLPSREILPK